MVSARLNFQLVPAKALNVIFNVVHAFIFESPWRQRSGIYKVAVISESCLENCQALMSDAGIFADDLCQGNGRLRDNLEVNFVEISVAVERI
jgi:hypothetical protein